jgi:hypothetical protein
VKILISISFGALGYLASLLADSGNRHVVVGLAVSLFVGGVAFVVQFLHDVEKRLDATEDAYESYAGETEQRLASEFRKISEATELFSLIEASPLSTDMVTRFVRKSSRVPANPPLVFGLVQAEMERLSELVKAISEGADATYDGEDRDWLLSLTEAASTSIDATSLTTVDAGGKSYVDGGLWVTDLGQRYLEAQRDAVARGVAIRRIFIVDRPELLTDPGLAAMCKLHRDEFKVDARILDPTKLPGNLRAGLFDFVIFDGVLSYQSELPRRVQESPPMPSAQPLVITHLVTRPSALRQRMQRFQDLWTRAT